MPLPFSDNNHDQFPAEPDLEQQDEALSPTDGYFHASDSLYAASPAVPLVPNVLVEDPTLIDRGADDKAREVEDEQRQITSQGQLGNEAGVHSSPFVHHHHRRSVEDAAFPSTSHTAPQASPYQQASVSYLPNNRGATGDTRSRLHHPDAPPAYSPAGLGYQTIVGVRGAPLTSVETPPVMGVPEEQQRLLPIPHTREPQSMGGNPSDNGYPQRQTLCHRFKESLTRVNTRRLITTLLGALLILSIISLIYGAVFGHKDTRYSKPVIKDESNMEWSPHRQCYNRPHTFPKITKSVDFTSGKSLSVTQGIEQHDGPQHGRQPHVFGELIIKPTTDANAQSSGQLDIEVISNDESLRAQFSYDDGAQKYTVTVPRSVDWHVSNLSPCIQIRITIWAPPGANLDTLDVQLVQLDVDIRPGVQLNAALGAALRSVAGKINAPTNPHEFQSRNIELTTVSGDIRGWYPLYDLLRVRSESGTVKVDVGPKTVSPDHPKPARLDLSTVSGDVTAVATDMDDIPARDYVTSINTVSGTVKAKVPFSSSGEFETKSASFDLDLTPVLDQGRRAEKPKLTTKTVSGTTKVVLHKPFWVNLASTSSAEQHVLGVSRVLDSLHSDHSSMSGTITLRYPSVWEGTFYADTMSGSQSFRGDGVQVDRRHGWVNKVVEGHKGSGKSELKVHTISGSEDFLVG